MAELLARYSTELWTVAVLAAVFVGVVAFVWGVGYLLSSRTSLVKDRLRRTVGSGGGGAAVAIVGAGSQPGVPAEGGLLQQALSAISRVGRPASEEELGRLRRRLSQAGFRSELALVSYIVAKMALSVGVGVLVVWATSLRAEPWPWRIVALYALTAMTLTFYLPNAWLYFRVKGRQSEINHALPDALDLVVTCVEAGLGLDAALERVSGEIAVSSSLLAQELAQASLEMRAAMPRGETFRRLAARTGVEELHNLAAIIIQTDIFGTSVARSLRVQAEAMRVRRTQLAEERAATVAVKLTIPLILCILPTLFVVLMGPAAIRIIRMLLPALRGE